MHKLFPYILLGVCSGCAKDHVQPPANLIYVSVEREKSLLYDIRYESDIDVLDLFDRGERQGMASGTLECALADDYDFSVDKAIQFSAVGVIESEKKRVTAKAKFSYLTSVFLVETSSSRSSQRDLSASELNHLLANKQQIPCKVVVTAYGYKPYYSNTMNIPVADLLREINKPR
ncbi:hypothetical protein PS619_04274 [Pseudomonas fluorescens]|uniref:Lipoprotein n=1 Tax=Pseudomonas tensinigenes TaxID=2745511 RepID=A0ABX8PSJ7_9PSED|nr:hypothetical protein [Pseudomonas tensinigenes]QXI04389.1 hypothetical protein HU718_020395 [Pseudomonas tensinigenes]VVN20118.1 hypothetical protein PS619_04274 [Pseudomonas fluorescens]VVN48769.1 hypothetical protein PS681_06127 [Pseudomonas fluorescens]VVN60170.1 hypothetical protein PS684_03786 [Pseudomonas fluorescens]